MQRLFSTFANGLPGKGLLIQRALVAAIAISGLATELGKVPHSPALIPQIIAALAGALVVAGLWTPIAGSALALAELYIVVSRTGDPWMAIVAGMLGGTLAIIGPGAWSIDARLFGRKHIEIPNH
jgi:putative oxidoreductase